MVQSSVSFIQSKMLSLCIRNTSVGDAADKDNEAELMKLLGFIKVVLAEILVRAIPEGTIVGGDGMAEKVKIPIAIFEYRADFKRPVFDLLLNRAKIVQALFDALSKWKPAIDDIDSITTGKPSEQGFNIKLPQKRVAFFFGASLCRFTKENAGWDTAEETIEILNDALETLIGVTGVELSGHKTAFALHLQPRTKSFLDILRPFLSPALESLGYGKLQGGASIAMWDHGKITVDGSASIANAVYVRLDREFPVTASFEEIARELRASEESIFKMLDIEEDVE
jgi:hypothetical protein